MIKRWSSGVVSNNLLRTIIIGQLSTYHPAGLLFYWSIGILLFSDDLLFYQQDLYYLFYYLLDWLLDLIGHSGLLILSMSLLSILDSLLVFYRDRILLSIVDTSYNYGAYHCTYGNVFIINVSILLSVLDKAISVGCPEEVQCGTR